MRGFIGYARHLPWCRFCLGPLLLCAVLTTGGCAVNSIPGEGPPADVLRSTPHTSFAFSGRISVRVDDRIDSGLLRWERDALRDTERIALMTPLGSQVAELTREGALAEFRRGEERRSGEIGALTESLIGVALDLNRIAALVQGAGLDSQGRAIVDTRDGRRWDVQAEGPSPNANFWIARRLTLQSGSTVVKLVVDAWEAK